MTGFTFSLEQLLAAPPEVRRWAEQQIGAALAELSRHPALRGGGTILPYHAASEYPLQRIAMQQPLLTSAGRAMPPFETARAAEMGHAPAAGEADGHTGGQQSARAQTGREPAGGEKTLGDGEQPVAPSIAACGADEAVKLFSMLQEDLPTAQVFFELGRETATSLPQQELSVFSIGDIMRHARLSDGRQLLGCLKRINLAFQRLRGASDLSLFGIDSSGYLYVHAATHRSIHQLWTDLLALEAEKHPEPIVPAKA